MNRLYTLQAVRGLGALSVLLFHAAGLVHVYFDYDYFGGIFKYGDLGVDLFFVLSGFIMYYIHSKDIGRKDKGKMFLLKRFVRIFPFYWLLLGVIIPIYFVVPSFGAEGVTNGMNILKSIVLFPQPMELYPLVVAWTLSHEMLFYLLFGILIAFRRRISFPIVASWMALSITVFLTHDFLWDELSFISKFLFSPFNLEFLAGVLIAILVLRNKTKQGIKLVLLGLVGFSLTFINKSYGLLDIHRIIEYGVPSVLLIYGLVACEKNKQIKVPKTLSYLGDASYSIFLTHAPILSLINKVFMSLGIYEVAGYFLATTIMVFVTVVLGSLFHTVVENTLLKYLNAKLVYNQNTVVEVQQKNA